MKYLLSLVAVACLLITTPVNAQNRPPASPPAKVSETINSGATLTINYSQPSLKGRTIGKDVEPMKDKVWRMGANSATTFETDKDVTIQGQPLPAGKYSVFGVWTDDGYTVIFNQATGIWGTQYEQNKEKDVLKVKADVKTADASQEQLTYTIDKTGAIKLLWGKMVVGFNVK